MSGRKLQSRAEESRKTSEVSSLCVFKSFFRKSPRQTAGFPRENLLNNNPTNRILISTLIVFTIHTRNVV